MLHKQGKEDDDWNQLNISRLNELKLYMSFAKKIVGCKEVDEVN